MYVNIDEVVATAETVVKTADKFDTNIWKQWVYQAVINLGMADDEIKVDYLYPKGFTAKLPEGCRQVIEMACYDSNGTQVLHQVRTGKVRIAADVRVTPSATTGDTNINTCLPADISYDTSHIHLGTNAESVATIAVRYFAYPIDGNGMPMVREEDVMACVYFIRYMQALRDDDNRSKIEQDRIEWHREADRSRARKKMSSMTPDKARTIMNSLMKVVPAFSSIQSF